MTRRVEIDNDLFVESDGHFTSGVSFQRHSELAAEWTAIDMPRWTRFGSSLPGLGAAGLRKRIGFAVGQNAQTPADIDAVEPIPDDLPYAASLAAELNWTAFDDERFRGYALIAGMVGPAAGARAVQKFVHEATGDVWRDSPSVDRRVGLTTLITGFHLHRPGFSLPRCGGARTA